METEEARTGPVGRGNYLCDLGQALVRLAAVTESSAIVVDRDLVSSAPPRSDELGPWPEPGPAARPCFLPGPSPGIRGLDLRASDGCTQEPPRVGVHCAKRLRLELPGQLSQEEAPLVWLGAGAAYFSPYAAELDKLKPLQPMKGRLAIHRTNPDSWPSTAVLDNRPQPQDSHAGARDIKSEFREIDRIKPL